MSDDMEALRGAVALMRTRAEAATPGPWEASVGDSGLSYRALNASVITEAMGDQVAECDYDGYAEGPHGEEGADAYFIASWHPVVALAVAKALEAHAEEHSSYDCRWEPCPHVALAHAYLSEG